MNSRLYLLSSFVLLSACVQSQQPASDAFMQSELMPPKIEEVAEVQEKKESQETILSEILEAIKAPLVLKQESDIQPQQQTQQVPPITIPQTNASNVMPQILQATPSNGDSAPFVRTVVMPQTTQASQATVQQQVQQPTAPFYSTPMTQNMHVNAGAPAQNLPVQPVQQAQPIVPTQVNQLQHVQPTYSFQQPQQIQVQPVQQAVAQESIVYMIPETSLVVPGYQPQEYANYQQATQSYQQANVVSNSYGNSGEMILPESYQVPQVQKQVAAPSGHVMSGQEAYPVWNSKEAYYDETKPSPLNNMDSQSGSINIPRW